MADSGSGQQAQNFGINPWLIAVSVMLATFMEVLDTAIASVALPYIAGSLSATTDEATWVLTSYLVANAIILPASNWFSLRFGRKRFLMTCVVIFTVASFACGAAPTLGFMLLARVIQGAGGGALQPLSQAILLESFPPAKRGAAMAVFAFGVVVAPVLGPTLGGWLTDTYSWRYAFYINIPIGILALFMISRFIHDPAVHQQTPKSRKFDNIGFGTLVVWIGCLQIILDKGQEDDWFGATWIRWALFFLRHRARLVHLSLLAQQERRWSTSASSRTATSASAACSSSCSASASTPRSPSSRSSTRSCSATPPSPPASSSRPAASAPSAACPSSATSPTRSTPAICSPSASSPSASPRLYFGNLTLEISPTTLLLPILITGFGLSFVFVPITTAAYGTLRNDQIGNASGIFNLMRNVGGSIGISIAQTLLIRRSDAHQAYITGYVSQTQYWFEQRLSALTGYLTHHTAAPNAAGAAAGTLYRQLGRQALLWAYVDVFRWMSLSASSASCWCGSLRRRAPVRGPRLAPH